jgi:hypothetical protein
MPSLYDSIYKIMSENNYISNAELMKIFHTYTKKYVLNIAAQVRNVLQLEHMENTVGKKKVVSIELIEPIIFDKITKNPNNQDLKLAVEILKLKAQDKGMTDDLDIDKYVKKSLELYNKAPNNKADSKDPNYIELDYWKE